LPFCRPARPPPAGREGSLSWIDAAGGLWLWGGGGLDSAAHSGYLNDLWRYDRPLPLEVRLYLPLLLKGTP
jgi:hypothetical protein